MAGQYGLDLSKFPDDAAAVQFLGQQIREARQLQQYAPYVQQVIPHWSEIQEWLQSRQQQAPATTQGKSWWSEFWQPPEYDPAWVRLIEVDPETGQYRAKAGAPPDVANKFAAWQHYQSQQADKLMSNPFAYFEKAFETLAEKKAKEIMQQSLGQHQETLLTRQFLEQNSGWLYQRDAQGNVLTNPWLNPATGSLESQPVLSPYGQQFKRYVDQAVSLGISSVAKQKDYALMALERDMAIQQLQQKQQPQQAHLPAGSFPQQPAPGVPNLPLPGVPTHGPNFAGSVPPGFSPTPQPEQNENLSLNERLRRNLALNGITDRDIQTSR